MFVVLAESKKQGESNSSDCLEVTTALAEPESRAGEQDNTLLLLVPLLSKVTAPAEPKKAEGDKGISDNQVPFALAEPVSRGKRDNSLRTFVILVGPDATSSAAREWVLVDGTRSFTF